MHSIGIRLVVEAFLEELGSAMRNHTIALHLAKPKSAVS